MDPSPLKNSKAISVVVALYNESLSLSGLYRRLVRVLEKEVQNDFEIITAGCLNKNKH